MADEQYEWLDKDAAERMLRGEPVGPVDDHARAQAARLRAALGDVSAQHGVSSWDAGRMPGEEAALAAFRDSAGDRAVRIGRDAAGVRPVRWARPVRFGVALAVAGCALGGVAVAAGTGALPLPFRGDDPMPASSVSAAATPGPIASESPMGGNEAPSPSAPPETHTPKSPAAPKTDEAAPGRTRVPTPDATGRSGGTDGNKVYGKDGDGKGTAWYRTAVAACRDYRSGRLDPVRRHRLASMADGARKVARFCDRILGASGDGKSDGKNDTGDGTGSGDGDGEGRGITPQAPPVSFVPEPSPTPVTSASSASAAPSPSPSGLTDQ
ncbi:hypothetical protein [Streptomyces sp. NBC_01465]|uniref:hypothetical protein n=1 Tax=Streptomyces sp. NBC_01465 TaxID=2903878 RepID=UPI002E3206FC|nr:hypothetical protein [Streptomyces sp. NBC_01465]